MVKTNEDWERLGAVIRRTGMTINCFAKYIGLPCGENIYRIKRGDNGISRDVAERIVKRFPDVSKGWLLSGEGSMIRENEGSRIPYFDGNMHDVLSGFLTSPAYFIALPTLDHCDLAVKYTNLDMDENITLLLQKTSREELESGKIYVFDTPTGAVLRKWDDLPEAKALARRATTICLVRGKLVMNRF